MDYLFLILNYLFLQEIKNLMKKSVFTLLIITTLSVFSGCFKTKTISTELPYDLIVDEIAYNLVYGKREAYVTGKQDPSSYRGEITIPSLTEYEVHQYKVTGIIQIFES